MEIELTKGYKALISPEHFECLNSQKWHFDSLGYPACRYKLDKKHYRMHRFIYKIILNQEIDNSIFIDHINNDKLDNRIENLRLSNALENVRNKSKHKDASSQFKGVYKSKNYDFYTVIMKPFKNKPILQAYYKDELHAAHQYNLWVDQFDMKGCIKNDIQIPLDFKLYNKKVKKDNLPKHITKLKSRYRVVIKQKHLGCYKTLEEICIIPTLFCCF